MPVHAWNWNYYSVLDYWSDLHDYLHGYLVYDHDCCHGCVLHIPLLYDYDGDGDDDGDHDLGSGHVGNPSDYGEIIRYVYDKPCSLSGWAASSYTEG